MKSRILFVSIAVLSLAGLVAISMRSGGSKVPVPQQSVTGSEVPQVHSHAQRVPAYQQVSQVDNLAPTLPPHKFTGQARAAYLVAGKIPKTLAQLPCYCECDRGFGHKSLQSCFVDEHASQCAVCVDEALLAYKLQTEEKLTPEQVREKIIEKYSTSP